MQQQLAQVVLKFFKYQSHCFIFMKTIDQFFYPTHLFTGMLLIRLYKPPGRRYSSAIPCLKGNTFNPALVISPSTYKQEPRPVPRVKPTTRENPCPAPPNNFPIEKGIGHHCGKTTCAAGTPVRAASSCLMFMPYNASYLSNPL
jgi:hypothetical protein